MSLTYPQLQHLYREIKPLVEGAVCGDISISGPASFTMQLRRGANVCYLFLCFRERFLRFHLVPRPVVDKKTVIPFVHKLANFLVGETVIDCTLLNDDRILAFTFKKGSKAYRVVAEFLPRRANCYLMDTLQRIEASLHPVDHLIYDLPMKPQQRHPEQAHVDAPVDLLDSHAVAKLYDRIEGEEEFAHRKREVESEVKKRCQRAMRRVEGMKEKLQECQGWPHVHHEGMLLQANLFRVERKAKEVVVSDWENEGKERIIVLDPLATPHDQVEAYFKRSKKLKAGLPHTEKQLKLAETDLALWMGRQEVLGHVSAQKELTEFVKKSRLEAQAPQAKAAKAKPEPAKPYHCFKSASGIEIWVGKSAKDNDKLTFHCARGLDWWLHASGCPGSHVVVRAAKGEMPDDETLRDAGELALRHSKAKGQGSGEVSVTQVKGVVPVKGVAGKVMISKHKTLRVKLDEKRWERLKDSGKK